jgi:hypothetical protein
VTHNVKASDRKRQNRKTSSLEVLWRRRRENEKEKGKKKKKKKNS